MGQLGYYTHYMVPGSTDFRLLQLGVRFYDPQVGRFTQRDDIRDDLISAYLYVWDRPLMSVDPTGLQADDPDDELRYRQCLATALTKFGKCVRDTFGVTDIGGALVGCLAGCAAASAWNGELSWPICAAGCTIGSSCYGAYTLVKTYFKCVVPYRKAMKECKRIRDGSR